MNNTSFYFHIDLKKMLIGIIGFIILYLVAKYNTGMNKFVDVPNEMGNVAGYWSGLWDGICAPFSLFRTGFNTESEIVYNKHNNGIPYAFGYLLPAGHYICYKFFKWILGMK